MALRQMKLSAVVSTKCRFFAFFEFRDLTGVPLMLRNDAFVIRYFDCCAVTMLDKSCLSTFVDRERKYRVKVFLRQTSVSIIMTGVRHSYIYELTNRPN